MRAEEARELASQGRVKETRVAFEVAYRAWACTAESELANVTGTVLVKPGLRGRRPRVRLRPIISDRKASWKGEELLPYRALKWVHGMLTEALSLHPDNPSGRKVQATLEGNPPQWVLGIPEASQARDRVVRILGMQVSQRGSEAGWGR